jgi:hypothetical protein
MVVNERYGDVSTGGEKLTLAYEDWCRRKSFAYVGLFRNDDLIFAARCEN